MSSHEEGLQLFDKYIVFSQSGLGSGCPGGSGCGTATTQATGPTVDRSYIVYLLPLF